MGRRRRLRRRGRSRLWRLWEHRLIACSRFFCVSLRIHRFVCLFAFFSPVPASVWRVPTAIARALRPRREQDAILRTDVRLAGDEIWQVTAPEMLELDIAATTVDNVQGAAGDHGAVRIHTPILEASALVHAQCGTGCQTLIFSRNAEVSNRAIVGRGAVRLRAAVHLQQLDLWLHASALDLAVVDAELSKSVTAGGVEAVGAPQEGLRLTALPCTRLLENWVAGHFLRQPCAIIQNRNGVAIAIHVAAVDDRHRRSIDAPDIEVLNNRGTINRRLRDAIPSTPG
mmetsp:Transcript_39267/g.108220  ORF Transcript_39267/g.108220 Transcript_39267/m.108220 type:complete len:285 (-) Transcript_39267:279-1133(-)